MTDLQKLLAEATPGPWEMWENSDTTKSVYSKITNLDICMITNPRSPATPPHINARLIAMAPDLAAALIKAKEALELIAKEDRLHGVTPGSNGHQSWHDGYYAVIARAALSEINNLRGG